MTDQVTSHAGVVFPASNTTGTTDIGTTTTITGSSGRNDAKPKVQVRGSDQDLEHDGDDNGVSSGGGSGVREIQGWPWALVVLAVLSSTFLYALDNTIMANVRPGIIDTFGHMDMLPWLSVSYPMGEVGASPLWGKLYAQFNNKYLYLFAVLSFEIGSAVIGAAQSIEMLVGGRVLCGLGGSGIYIGTMNLISAMTLAVERAQYLSYVGMAWSLGTVLGPIIGGALVDSSATWRWGFYINICIAAVTTPICIWLIPSHAPKSPYTLGQRIQRLDYLGALLFLGGMSSVIMVLGFGGALWAWSSARMIILYVSAGVLWTAFAIQQTFSLATVDRIFPVHFLASWATLDLFMHTATAISSLVVPIYTLPLYFQFTHGDSALQSGVYTLPFVLVVVVAAGLSGALLPKFPMYMAWFLTGNSLILVGSAALSQQLPVAGLSRATVCGLSAVQAAGSGLVAQLPFTVAQTKVGKAQTAAVTGFLTCAQMTGLAVSLGTITCVFVNLATEEIAQIVPGLSREAVEASVGGVGPGTAVLLGLPEALRTRVLGAIAANIGRVFYFNVVGSAYAIVTSVLMGRERLKFD